jgi:molybdopterin converting factor small subunit
MNIDIKLPPMFRQLAGTGESVNVAGETVGDSLRELVDRYPSLKEYIFTGSGDVNPGLTVFLNGENAFPGELARPVRDGDTLHLAQMVLGG